MNDIYSAPFIIFINIIKKKWKRKNIYIFQETHIHSVCVCVCDCVSMFHSFSYAKRLVCICMLYYIEWCVRFIFI